MSPPKNKTLPVFSPVSDSECRGFWKRYQTSRDIERLILEVQHNRRVIDEMHALYGAVVKCWREEGLGQLVCMEQLRTRLEHERMRRKGISTSMPPPEPPEEPEPLLID
jgi:hypothetical protein